jgi:hypothetical protein
MKTEKKTVEADSLTFKILWAAVKQQVQAAESFPNKAKFHYLSGLFLTFLTVEAYANHLGELLFYDEWQDERHTFRRGGTYPGSLGKIRFLADRCGMPFDVGAPPYSTIKELKSLRDTIAHGRTDRIREIITVPEGGRPPLLTPAWHNKVTSDFLSLCMKDSKALIEQLNSAARKAFPEEHHIHEHVLMGFFGSQIGRTERTVQQSNRPN